MNSFDSTVATSIYRTVVSYTYSTWKINKVDDKTIAFAINESVKTIVTDSEYYAEPDWKALQQQYDRLAYPSLYEADDRNTNTVFDKGAYIVVRQ